MPARRKKERDPTSRSCHSKGIVALPFCEPLFFPLPLAFTTDGLTASHTTLLTLGHKESLLFDCAQDAVFGDLFAEPPEQALGRFAVSGYDPGHCKSPPSVIECASCSKKPDPSSFLFPADQVT
jgi:hypothetical protein